MAIEIERKFLLKNNSWRQHITESNLIRQGYLAPLETSSVRVRVEGDKANINVKSATVGITRLEFEYEIPMNDAIEMLDKLCPKPQVHKTRHLVKYGDHIWEIDEFYDENQGLLVAEIELKNVDEIFDRPDWLGEEVSNDTRYYNVNLVNKPYEKW